MECTRYRVNISLLNSRIVQKRRNRRRPSECGSDSSGSLFSASASETESEETGVESESDEELAALKRKLSDLRKQKRRWDRKLQRIRKDDGQRKSSGRITDAAKEDDDGSRTARLRTQSNDRDKSSDKKRKRTAQTTMVDRMRRMEAKVRHPLRLHPELWFNEPHEMNDGPACNCR